MPGIKTTPKGRGAPTAAASSAEGMPGADESGELADADLMADILREAGGEPEAAESDGEASKSQKPKAKGPKLAARESEETAETDETADDTDTETEPDGETPEGETTEENQPEGEQAEGEESEADQPDGEAAEGEQPAAEEPKKDETPEWAKQRFSEYARKVETLERKLADAEARLAGGNTTQASPRLTDMALLEAETPEQLAQLRQKAEEIEEWCELHPEGVDADPDKPNSVTVTREQVTQSRIDARKRLRAIEAREKQLQQVQGFNAAAATVYPGFKDPDSTETRAARWILQQVPELKRLANYRLIIGDAIAGERVRMKAQQQTPSVKKGPNGQPLPGKPAATQAKRPPVVNGAPARGNAAPAGKTVVRAKARERAFRTGSEADIASLVEAGLG